MKLSCARKFGKPCCECTYNCFPYLPCLIPEGSVCCFIHDSIEWSNRLCPSGEERSRETVRRDLAGLANLVVLSASEIARKCSPAFVPLPIYPYSGFCMIGRNRASGATRISGRNRTVNMNEAQGTDTIHVFRGEVPKFCKLNANAINFSKLPP